MMKKISIIYICTFVIVAAIAGCGKILLDYGDIQKADASQSLLKINYVSQYANNQSIFLKINDQRVSDAKMTARTPFPGGGYNTGGLNNSNLLLINSGAVKVSVVLPHKIDNGLDSLVLYSTTFQATGGKNYSLHITDTAATTKNVLIEENIKIPDSAVVRYHFVNLMPNVPAIDLYFCSASATAADSIQRKTDSLVVGNIGYLQVSQYFTLKAGISKTWKIRPAGADKTAATILAFYTSASVVANQRVFTAFASGYSGKTNTQKPYISFFLVK